MPELPEVETVARILRPRVTGATIVASRAVPHEKWASARRLSGRPLLEVRRRGKHLLLDLDRHETLAIHLGMTGNVRVFEHAADAGFPAGERHERLALILDAAGSTTLLTLVDPRGFGHAVLAARDPDGGVDLAALRAMGPEPLGEWTAGQLISACARRSTAIKAALLDQSVVAGIGNYLADEILFAAGVNPMAASNSLSAARLRRIHDAAQAIIAAAVDAGGATISDYRHPDGSSGGAQFLLQAYGREGEPCPRCARPMKKAVVGGRGTTFCSACQRH